MNTQITINDLIASLRKAASRPEAHQPAQKVYFSELKEDSVLTHSGKACCVAGYLMLKANEGATQEKIDEILAQRKRSLNSTDWIASELRLTEVEATLAFDPDTHYSIHKQLADLLEAGLRLPYVDAINLSYNGTYTSFDCAYFGVFQDIYKLQDVLAWMRKIAK